MKNSIQQIIKTLAAIIAAAAAGLWVFTAIAQQQPRQQLTYQQLYDEVIKLQQQNDALRQSTAVAFTQAEQEGVESMQLREQLEALGVDTSEDVLQQRLIKAVRDVDIYRQENERQRKAIAELSENFIGYIAQTPEAPEAAQKEANQSIEKAGIALTELVDPAQIQINKLEKSKVVSYNDKLSFVILSAGKNSGVRVGTPISVFRDEQAIFTATITHVRDNLAGALLQENLADVGPPKVGDRIRPVTVRGR